MAQRRQINQVILSILCVSPPNVKSDSYLKNSRFTDFVCRYPFQTKILHPHKCYMSLIVVSSRVSGRYAESPSDRIRRDLRN